MRICRAAAVVLAVVFCMSAPGGAQFPPAPGTGPGLAETIEAIDSARVTTRILYVTAHPDDESAAVLTYLARGLHADVALLSLTRGEGGQNALGPEQAPQLGLIRTQELLAATQGYGVKLYFTRAKDFGFSKTPEEAEKVWGEDALRDIVQIIRVFRPNIVVNGWGGVHAGHGHHQAAGLLTPKAVQLAADKSFEVHPGCADCPEDFTWGSPTNPVVVLDVDRSSDHPQGSVLPLDDVSPLWGKSWRELGLNAFVNHRTQGVPAFVDSPFLRRPIALRREDGKALDQMILVQPLTALAESMAARGCQSYEGTPARVAEADAQLKRAREGALSLDWNKATKDLADAALVLRTAVDKNRESKVCLGNSTFLTGDEFDRVRARAERALGLAAGLSVSATADQRELVPGETIHVTIAEHCRTALVCEFSEPKLGFATGAKIAKQEKNQMGTVATVQVLGGAAMRHGWYIGEAEGEATGWLNQQIRISGYAMDLEREIQYVRGTSTALNRVPLRVAQPIEVYVDPKERIFPLPGSAKPFDIFLRVHSNVSRPLTLKVVTAEVPHAWTATNEEVKFDGKGDKYVRLTITPARSLEPGRYAVLPYARIDLPVLKQRPYDSFYQSVEPLPSMGTQLWEEPAQCAVDAFEISVPKDLKVGYITAESEPVPDSLRMLGIQVELLDAAALNFGDLSKYDAIVAGVRAYELRSELPGANQRLLDYVSNGGTLLVQYQRDFAWDGKNYAPYPTKIDGGPGSQLPRITDETATVNFLKPEDSLLNKPNKITVKDFDGWVQERGLYFWTDFDPARYTPLLSMHDPGEKDLNGGLVYTKLGKGTYVYSGLAFFRQLPEGVPGAYRLFVNLISASRSQ